LTTNLWGRPDEGSSGNSPGGPYLQYQKTRTWETEGSAQSKALKKRRRGEGRTTEDLMKKKGKGLKGDLSTFKILETVRPSTRLHRNYRGGGIRRGEEGERKIIWPFMGRRAFWLVLEYTRLASFVPSIA